MKLLWLDWENVDRLCRILARKIKRAGFSPDVVVGISRGDFPSPESCVMNWVFAD